MMNVCIRGPFAKMAMGALMLVSLGACAALAPPGASYPSEQHGAYVATPQAYLPRLDSPYLHPPRVAVRTHLLPWGDLVHTLHQRFGAATAG